MSRERWTAESAIVNDDGWTMAVRQFTPVILSLSLCFSTALSAQQPSRGPIRASLMDDVSRLTWVLPVDEQPRHRATGIESAQVQQSAAPPAPADALDSQWSRVRQLAVGTVIFVTVQGSPTAKRRFVSADPAALAVRDTGDPARAIETLARADIVEIKAPKARSAGRKVGFGIAGYFLGGMAGGLIGIAASGGQGGLIAVFPGAAVGTFVGVRGGFRRPYEVIFAQ